MKYWEFDGILTIGKTSEGGGWYIECEQDNYALYEIPIYGGEPQLINEFETLSEALFRAEALT